MLLGVAGPEIPPTVTDGGVTVLVDWDGDGLFDVPATPAQPVTDAYADLYSDGYADSGVYTDIYADVEGGASGNLADVTRLVRPQMQPVSVEYGRDQSTALSPTVAGRGGFTLDNRDRRYSPRNTAGPLYGKLKPARPVRITRTIGSLSYGLFTGHTDDSPISPDMDSQTVAFTLVDSMADFRGVNVDTRLYRDIRTGTAIGYILDAVGVAADMRDLDLGATVIPWWWEDGTDALTALEKIVRSEGPPALLTVGGGGEIIFRDRHHRLTRTPSLVSQSSWQPIGTTEPVMTRGFTYDEAWRNIINTGTASVEVRQLGALAEVWSSDTTVTLSPGEQRIITAAASEPFANALTPVENIDFRVLAGDVSARLIRTSGLSTAIELTASTANPATLTGLRLRAQPLTIGYTVQVSTSDQQSITAYGPRSFPGDLPWCGPGDAEAVLNVAVALRAEPLPVVSARFMIGTNTARSTAVLSRDLSDRVTVTEPETGLAEDFYVESIGHELTGVFDHTVQFGLEAVPETITPTAANTFRFNVSGAGFNQGLFGTGLDLSAVMFRFDNAAAGFNTGAFVS